MSASLTFTGLQELKEALRALPGNLTAGATGIVAAAADGAAADIRGQYPEDTGNLRRGVKVLAPETNAYGVSRVVRSGARHARLFETGTQTRQTALGYNRGFMPGANIFVPVLQQYRARMYDELAALMTDAGLDVRRG
jgi:hypothetical protein